MKFIQRDEEKNSLDITPESCIRLISTMPKSGTWSLSYFWAVFAALCAGADECDPFSNFKPLPTFGIDLFSVAHMFCPEYETGLHPSIFKRWKKMTPTVFGLDWGSAEISRYPDALPSRNRNWRMIFVYRNPLDQVASYYKQYSTYYDKPGHLYRIPKAGSDIHSFAKVGIASYIKYFLTFHHQRERFSDRILWVTYARMMREREPTLRAMVEFFLGALTDQQEKAFAQALEATSHANLKALEQRLGIALSDATRITQAFLDQQIDQEASERIGQQHIFSGDVGRWKNELPLSVQKYCLRELRRHDIPMSYFEFE